MRFTRGRVPHGRRRLLRRNRTNDLRLCVVEGRFIDPVELHTDMAGFGVVLSDVVELVTGQRQLEPGKRQQRQPRGTPQSMWTEQVIVLFQHQDPTVSWVTRL